MCTSRRIGIGVVATALVAGMVVAAMSARRPATSLSRETLAAGFDVGIHNLVFEWDPGDPRPVAARRQALFDFMYQTYRASAWYLKTL